LLSGDDDHQWPAAPMAEEIVRRMEDYGEVVTSSTSCTRAWGIPF